MKFADWFNRCGLQSVLGRPCGQYQGFLRYGYKPERRVVEPEGDWEQSWHGTWWYAVPLLFSSGVLLESSDRGAGHDFGNLSGVYCSPSFASAREYARPQVLFDDGTYHRAILELHVNPRLRSIKPRSKGMQWVLPSAGVAVTALWVEVNSSVGSADERLDDWKPELEPVMFSAGYRRLVSG